jgi:hypothetical protein
VSDYRVISGAIAKLCSCLSARGVLLARGGERSSGGARSGGPGGRTRRRCGRVATTVAWFGCEGWPLAGHRGGAVGRAGGLGSGVAGRLARLRGLAAGRAAAEERWAGRADSVATWPGGWAAGRRPREAGRMDSAARPEMYIY